VFGYFNIIKYIALHLDLMNVYLKHFSVVNFTSLKLNVTIDNDAKQRLFIMFFENEMLQLTMMRNRDYSLCFKERSRHVTSYKIHVGFM